MATGTIKRTALHFRSTEVLHERLFSNFWYFCKFLAFKTYNNLDPKHCWIKRNRFLQIKSSLEMRGSGSNVEIRSKWSTVSIFDFEKKTQRNLQLLPTSQEITVRNVVKKAKRTYRTVNSFRLYKRIFNYSYIIFLYSHPVFRSGLIRNPDPALEK